MTLTGAEGEIRQGYFVAAEIGSWSFTGDRTGGVLTAPVRSKNAFRLEQPGLTVVVPFGQNGKLRWPILAMQIANGSVTVTVGERE